jgi:hypothetical protein
MMRNWGRRTCMACARTAGGCLARARLTYSPSGVTGCGPQRVARICPARCFALCTSQIWPRQMRQSNTTGKSARTVQCSLQKYSAFAVGQISGLTPRVSPDERGVRTSRTRGEMRWTRRLRKTGASCSRTAKSCGPDAAVLASSLREVSRRRRWQKSRSPGRARSKAVKPLRRESSAEKRPDKSILSVRCVVICVAIRWS